ncbi:CoA-transferase [Neobacillus sp. OS1-32]|uniref:CoA-transferase n=1 Tax=Neobacillus sp. OS1-32 TaxID=3070682 RepID=UPI0027E09AB0|nr:CoA-transferase [Neobacillus sp. OS1-32]WML31259.1 CoA-transferase [Neobacillus sp. OS1-32]
MSKVICLEECVKQVIHPNSTLHFSFTHNRPMAFAWEIIRQFSHTKLQLHLVGTGMLEYAIALIWAGHVKKLEGAFFGETYPSPSPNRLISKLAREGKLEIEYWTNLTIPQRLMASAYRLDFIPTRSLVNSSILEEHVDSGKAFTVKDPIGENETVMIRRLIPDVTVVHGSVADEDGNTVITPPYGEDLWGVFAAKKVVVVVEKIVDKAAIQPLSHLVKIPAHKVDYVVEVPLSAHPYGVSPIGYSDAAYTEDYAFRVSFSEAIKGGLDIMEFMEQWDLDKGHEAFLEKLGTERIAKLKSNFTAGSLKNHQIDCDSSPTSTEKLIVSASRIIAEKIKSQNIKTILAGIGVSHLTAWLVYKRLKAEGIPIQLMTETGYYGYEPVNGDPYIFNFGNLFTNMKQSSFVEILGQFVGDPSSPCLAILSAAQIDSQGNLNSTKIPEKNVYLTGSGGANDIASVASDVAVMMNGDSRKFINKVPYVTSTGEKVSTIFTNLAVLTRKNSDESFSVSHWIPGGTDASQYREMLGELLPWEIPVLDHAVVMSEPSRLELEWLRALDPEKVFLQ